MEKWKDIEGYEGLYRISTEGRVWSNYKKRILQNRINNKGYLYVELRKGSCGKKGLVHRLVATAFVPRREGANEVNHIDSNPLNCSVENLEWVTSSENTKHAIYKGRLNAWGNPARPVESTDVETGETIRFATLSQAEVYFGSRHIVDVLKGRRKTCKGNTFRYLSDEGGDASVDFNYKCS